jgi:hypothetical protein
MKKNLVIAFMAGCLIMAVLMLGCAVSTTTSGATADNLKFKAENVMFRVSTVKASDEFTDQKVYADDVVLNNANTSLTADNVQTAFEETQPKLSEIIVGEWDVVVYENNFIAERQDDLKVKQKTGTITFNNDNTYSFTGAGRLLVSAGLWSDNDLLHPTIFEIYNENSIGLTCWAKEIVAGGYITISKIKTFSYISNNKLVCNDDKFIIIFTKQIN